jgi:hypothetical protein
MSVGNKINRKCPWAVNVLVPSGWFTMFHMEPLAPTETVAPVSTSVKVTALARRGVDALLTGEAESLPQHDLFGGCGQEAELREGVGGLAQHGPLCITKDALPGLLRVEVVWAGQFDGLSQVLVMDVQEPESGVLLAHEVESRHRSEARTAERWKANVAPVPDAPPAVGIDSSADLPEDVACLERVALVGVEEVTNVRTHSLDDADTCEELEVHADPQEPRRVGEVILLADDVGPESVREGRICHVQS